MRHIPSRAHPAASHPKRPRRDRKVLRWATVSLLLLLAAVAAR